MRALRRSRAASGSPSSSTVVPASGGVRPSRTRASVVLPLPDSPTRPSVSPAATARSTSTSARTSWPSWLNVFARVLEPRAPASAAASRTAAPAASGSLRAAARARLVVEVAAAARARRRPGGRAAPRSRQISLRERRSGRRRRSRGASAPSCGRKPGIVSSRSRVLAQRRRAGCSAAARPCTGGAARVKTSSAAPSSTSRPA